MDNDVQSNDKYLGDATKANWVSEGKPIAFDGGLLLTMPANSPGTLLSSTHYVWYGKISATMKSSRGQGVVTAFILMSDVKDEIDCEFIGSDNQAVQSNFYWQGTLNYTNEKNLTTSSTDTDMHTYTIDWTPDKLEWSVDGNTMRTLNKDDTWNSSTESFQYPQTPSRVQFSLWPAGDPKNGKGTVDWAGGAIDWNSPYMHNGYYSAFVKDLSVECYDAPPDAHGNGKKSYKYTDDKGLNNSVSITNDNTIIGSLFATGDDPKLDPSASKSSSDKPINTNAASVPGIAGSGTRGDSSSNSDGGDSGGSSGGGGGGGSSGQSINGGTDGSFSQGNNVASGGSSGGGGSSQKSDASPSVGTAASQGSVFAGMVALVALIAF